MVYKGVQDARGRRWLSAVLLSMLALVLGLPLGSVVAAEMPREADIPADVERVEGAQPSMAVAYLLDDAPGAFAAYSLRQLSSTYTGPAIRVRNTTIPAETDIGFNLLTGELDEVALLLACPFTTDCRVTTWYSQIAGVPDAVQPVPDLQPWIVENGVIARDDGGFIAMRFENKGPYTPSTHFIVSGMASYSSQDVTAFLVADSDGGVENDSWGAMLVLQEPDEWAYAATRIELTSDGSGQIAAGNDANAASFSEIPYPVSRTIYTLRAAGNELYAYRNHRIIKEGEHDRSPYNFQGLAIGGDSKDGRNAHSGFISEVVLYPNLNDADRLAVYSNLNTFWQTGPFTYNLDVLLPQDWQYQVDLYDWLETITLGDIAILPVPLDLGLGLDVSSEELANLWLSMSNVPTPANATRGEACWFVLDDGGGCGIEATGAVKIYYKGEENNTGGYGNDPAFWYQLDVPLVGGLQGNYYYQNSAVGLRALIVSAVEMMMWDRSLDELQGARRNDYYGKALAGWAYAYHHTRELLSPDVQAAFETGMSRFLDRTITWGATDINTNMDMFFIHGAAILYKNTSDPTVKAKAIQASKRVLFGYTDGEIDTKHDVDAGGFFPAGYIGEADGPETTYNGQSYDQLIGALSYVYEDPEWDFLAEVVERMSEFKLYQYYADPPTGGGIHPFYEGPAGYANRTGGSYIGDQANKTHRNVTVAAILDDALPLARQYGYWDNPYIKSESAMAEELVARFASINLKGFATVIDDTPPTFEPFSSWPADRAYLPPAGWHADLDAALTANAPESLPPLVREGFYYNKVFGGLPTGGEFWAYKASDQDPTSPQDFSFFLETDAQQGTYSGWYGGKLEAFWTEGTGLLVLNRHDKTGCSEEDKENSTCWNQIDYWGAHHVWGKDENGRAFSTAQIRGRELNRTATVDAAAATPYAEVVNLFNDPQASEGNDGEETGDELTGNVFITNRFEARDNGIEVIQIVESDNADQITELWASLPMYLRYNFDEAGGQASLPDATIEYWNGRVWKALTTSSARTALLRIGRDYEDGEGIRYGYVNLHNSDGEGLAVKSVKLSSQAWEQTYQGKARIRNVQIDLHGNPGNALQMPDSAGVVYTITTSSSMVQEAAQQDVELASGWNTVSGSVLPADTLLDDVFSSIAGEVVLVKDAAGKVYHPGLDIDQIGAWNALKAYKIYVSANSTLTLSGTSMTPEAAPFSLKEGWNLIPYIKEESAEVEEALASILPHIVLMKDNAGTVFSPPNDIYDLHTLQQGEGYWVYMDQAAELVYQ